MPPEKRTSARAPLARIRSIISDPRLLIGLALVAGSVAGVLWIVSSVDETIDVYIASDALAPGDRITATDLSLHGVRLDSAADQYLGPGDIPSGGVVVTRPVGAGELLPRSAVGDRDGVMLTAIVLSSEGRLPESVAAGSTVDVWAAPRQEGSEVGPPAVVVSGATVVRLVQTETLVAGGEVTAVEVLVPKARIARLLEALANSDTISIVPTSIPLRG